jgi:hypothetical protein
MIRGLLLAVVATYVIGTWLAGLSVLVLLLIWHLCRATTGPSVIAMALSYQWAQVTLGIFYHGLTGEMLPAIEYSDYEPMVLIGLGCVVALAVGLRLGIELMRRRHDPGDTILATDTFSWRTLLIVYLAAIATMSVVQRLAWEYPGFTQAILALSFSRLAVLFLMLRRLVAPVFQWKAIAVLMAIETALGFTGYFAGFREPMILAAIATFEVFDRRSVQHWVTAATLILVLGLASVVWMGVRTEYRQDYESDVLATSRAARLQRMQALTSGWFAQDRAGRAEAVNHLVDRVWAVYYPALAVSRVPNVLPHTDGAILTSALTHLITPRILFPDKGDLPSDSEMVRKYSGVMVAGAEQNTSIAFGYAAESYLDFGIPLMFLPSLVFGLVMGMAYEWLLATIRHRDIAIPVVTVIFWLALYLFERSWVKTFGITLTMIIYLGGLCFLLDRFLTMRTEHEATLDSGSDALPADAP